MTAVVSEKTNPRVCPHQSAFMLDNWLRKLVQQPGKIVGEYIKAGDTVVDIGCGPGFFTIDMAKQVGPSGRVTAVDLQPQMLAHVRKKAARHNVSEQVILHQCTPESVGLQLFADFILCFYMVHETPDAKRFFMEISDLLKPDGRILVVEPGFHVSREAFARMLKKADSAGLKTIGFPKGKGGRSVLLGRRAASNRSH
jgi:ubiquinone/menaquinone biosynthesis C-methylase UbiE